MEDIPSFKSRLLSTYLTNLPGGKQGCFFYIKETRCICLLDTPYRKGDELYDVTQIHKSEVELSRDPDSQVAWGFIAYLIAVTFEKGRHSFDIEPLRTAYMKEYQMEELSHTSILKDWCDTLSAIDPFAKAGVCCLDMNVTFFASVSIQRLFDKMVVDPSLDDVMLMHDGRLLLHEKGLPLHVHFFRPDCGKPMFAQLVLTDTPSYDSFQRAFNDKNWVAFGFVAVLFSNAIQHFYRNLWNGRYLVFEKDSRALLHAITTSRENDFYYPPILLQQLFFDFNFTYIELIKKYLEETVDVVLGELSYDPIYPLELAKGNNVYSYIYYLEFNSYSIFKASHFYSMLSDQQKNQIDIFFKRYLQYLENEYGANMEFLDKISMREYGQIAPVQISLVSHLKVTDKDGNDVTLERARMSGWVLPEENEEGEYHWPTYSSQATDEDKIIFENHLREICKIKKRSLSKDVKSYLKLKENDGIIIRPSQINTEYEYVKKFGYPYQESAYYSA